MENSLKDLSSTKRKKKCFNFFVRKNKTSEKDGDALKAANGEEINLIEKHEEDL